MGKKTYSVVLLKHHLVALVLTAHAEHLDLHLLLPALVLLLELHLLQLLLSRKFLLSTPLILLLDPELFRVFAFKSGSILLLATLRGLSLSYKGVLFVLVLLKHPLLLGNLSSTRVKDGRRCGRGRRGRLGPGRFGSLGKFGSGTVVA